eukprot:3616567-Amphidinium_carterae.1
MASHLEQGPSLRIRPPVRQTAQRSAAILLRALAKSRPSVCLDSATVAIERITIACCRPVLKCRMPFEKDLV